MTSFLTRRELGMTTISTVLTYSFLEAVLRRDALGEDMKLVAARWIKDANDMSRDLKGQKLKQTEWQTKVEELYERVDVAEFLRALDFEKLTAKLPLQKKGELSIHPPLPKVEGLPELAFGYQIFVLSKGRSVVPHGHNNMATSFLILGGEFHGRHFDRLEDEQEHLIIRPTIDRTFKAGEHSSISDFKDNVHWFEATTDKAYIFNIHVDDVRPGSKLTTGRVYIDPNGEKLSENRIRAKRLAAKDAISLYG